LEYRAFKVRKVRKVRKVCKVYRAHEDLRETPDQREMLEPTD
jgi:hypothetical protein